MIRLGLPFVLGLACATAQAQGPGEELPGPVEEPAEAPPEPAPPPADEARLRLSLAADEAYQACVQQLDQRRYAQARACFAAVIATHEGTTASLRARAALDVARHAEPPDVRLRAGRGSAFLPGHLGLVTTQASFGILNGAVGAMALGQAPNADRSSLILGGGAAAVGLGLGLGVGTHLIAENLELSPGDAQLWGNTTQWGVGLGLTLAPWMFAIAGAPWPEGALPPFNDEFQRALPVALIPSLVLGWAGVATGFGLSRSLDLDPGQVSTVGTGGWVGIGLGFAITPLLEVIGFGDPVLLGFVYLASGSAGLVGGGFMARVLDLEPWEVWLIDLATGLTFAAFGGVSYLLRAGGPDPARDVTMGTLTTAATVAALIGSTAWASSARADRGDPVWRSLRVGGAPQITVSARGLEAWAPLLSGRF
jgi:hypothetical protein